MIFPFLFTRLVGSMSIMSQDRSDKMTMQSIAKDFAWTLGITSFRPFVATLLAIIVPQVLQAFDRGTRPNVLMIVLDDLNDYVGCLGGYDGESPTPNIDALATRGMLFTNAHCNSPLCNPSRTSAMTGLHPATTGVHSNGPKWFEAVPQAMSLPAAFRLHGYFAAGCGKIFHSGKQHHPEHIWDAFFQQVVDSPKVPPMHRVTALANSTTSDDFDWGRQRVNDMQTGDGQAVRWAIDQLSKERSVPLFLAVGIFRPHLPLYAPEQHFDRFPLSQVKTPVRTKDDFEDIPVIGRALRAYECEYFDETRRAGKESEVVQAYLACCSLADSLVGQLLSAFGSSRFESNSIILLWSDHGWHLGEKDKFQKHALWEPSTHVPLIVVAPGVTKPGSRSAEAVTLLDIYPTLMDLCSLPSPGHLEGESLRPILVNPDLSRERPAVTTFGVNNHAVRDEHWRYIRYRDATEELYDLRNDPEEWKNLASVVELQPIRDKLSTWLPTTNAAAKGPPKFPDVLPEIARSDRKD